MTPAKKAGAHLSSTISISTRSSSRLNDASSRKAITLISDGPSKTRRTACSGNSLLSVPSTTTRHLPPRHPPAVRAEATRAAPNHIKLRPRLCIHDHHPFAATSRSIGHAAAIRAEHERILPQSLKARLLYAIHHDRPFGPVPDIVS